VPDRAFGRDRRLRKSGEFQSVFDRADCRVSHKYFILLARAQSPVEAVCSSRPRLGLVVGKKNVKLAVGRNRVKRLVRESFRQNQHSLPSIDIIFVARRGVDQVPGRKLGHLLQQSWLDLAEKQKRGKSNPDRNAG